MSVLLQKIASEVQYSAKKSRIFLIEHFGQRVNGGPIAHYANAASSNTATRSLNLLFLIIFNNLCILHSKFWHFVGRVAMRLSLKQEV